MLIYGIRFSKSTLFLGLDHPLVATLLRKFRDLPPEEIGVRVRSPDETGILAMWSVEARGEKGQVKRMVIPLAVDAAGKRLVSWERQPEKLWKAPPSTSKRTQTHQLALLRKFLEPMLQPELEYRGLETGSRGFESKLIGWVEGTPGETLFNLAGPESFRLPRPLVEPGRLIMNEPTLKNGVCSLH